jgi:hypothetical protein
MAWYLAQGQPPVAWRTVTDRMLSPSNQTERNVGRLRDERILFTCKAPYFRNVLQVYLYVLFWYFGAII